MEYKAKETFYDGIFFRSKNEAKWARFFDLVRIRYQYEPLTVYGWNNYCYKPDFYFPDYDIFAEVKSNVDGIQNDQMAAKLNGAIDYQATQVSKGLLLLGSFPFDIRINSIRLRTKWLFWYKGVCCSDAFIEEDEIGTFSRIRYSKTDIDIGEPLPQEASPDIYVEKHFPGEYLRKAIDETNEFFYKEDLTHGITEI